MLRILRLWFVTLLVYGAVVALLIFVAVPKGYDSGVLWPRPGWNVRSYQRRALPLAAAGYVVLAAALSLASRGGKAPTAPRGPRPAAR
jgi:hypothetical protein